MKSKISKIVLFLALILLPLGTAKAMETKSGDSIYIAKGEIVTGNLYAAGNTLTIDGDVSGDVIAAAQTININGRVEGDVIAAAQTININGEVGGNIRVAGNTINLNGPVTRNVNAFGSNIIFGTNSNIGWDAFIAGAIFDARGTIDGSLSGSAANTLISGKIGKDVNLKLSDNKLTSGLYISPEASIGGDLTYTGKKLAQISEKASLGGKVIQKMPEVQPVNWFALWAGAKVYSILAALIIGLVLVLLLKKVTPKILKKIEEKPLRTLLIGLIVMFVIPPIALILFFTIIGIPLALILMAWWLIVIYVTKIFAAILVGQIIIKKLTKKNDTRLIWSLVIGVIVCWLLFAIPFVGWFLGLIAIWFGLGGLISYVTHQLRNI